MTTDLFQLVSEDFDLLRETMSERLVVHPAAQTMARELGRLLPTSGLLDNVDLTDTTTVDGLCVLALSSDCLRIIVGAIWADRAASGEELAVAHTLVAPLALTYAKAFDEYAPYTRLTVTEVPAFLNLFCRDTGLFGGSPESPCAYIGATLTAILAIILSGDLNLTPDEVGLLSSYEHMAENIMFGIMASDGVNRSEMQALDTMRELHRSLRGLVDRTLALQRVVPTGSTDAVATPSSSETFIGSPADAPPSQDTRSPVFQAPRPLGAVLEELNVLVGLADVKHDVSRLASFLEVQRIRQRQGLKAVTVSHHLVFKGNPGTGKTTVARIIAELYRSLGVLPQGHLVETDRSGLVGGYLGQTALKTKAVIESALGGVLFIDEAYSLTDKTGQDLYGSEAIEVLLKMMEDQRDNLVVIVAGYTAKMQEFLSSNPGLRSRFNRVLNFPDYAPPELLAIVDGFAHQSGYELSAGARDRLLAQLTDAFDTRDEAFGNARLARNVFEQMITGQACRVLRASDALPAVLRTIEECDVPHFGAERRKPGPQYGFTRG